MDSIIPEVGMGATLLYPSDRYPYTIVHVSKGKHKIIAQKDTVTLTSGSIFDGIFDYTPNPSAKRHPAYLNKHGQYIMDGCLFHVGSREYYRAREV